MCHLGLNFKSTIKSNKKGFTKSEKASKLAQLVLLTVKHHIINSHSTTVLDNWTYNTYCMYMTHAEEHCMLLGKFLFFPFN